MTCKLTNFVFIELDSRQDLQDAPSHQRSLDLDHDFCSLNIFHQSSAMIFSLSFIVRADVFSATFAISDLKSRKEADENERRHRRIETRYEEHSS